ncbi:MAG: 23S rRNA (uracil(1939)-C(5))-methyltransferase RlmD [Christensenellaceae bacterium]|jgi:23S rRNA (uracil1939-C5)-methyltransferase|nr:23S rRNA (uracil(1939)-C(5))-methyltransferase RlmD [Christensenellaceae bacterium]
MAKSENMKVGQKLIVNIHDIGMNGEGISRLTEHTIFIPHALIGETCEVEITSLKANIIGAKLCDVKFASPDRVEPICPLFGKCGGCDLMHMKYEKQLEYKQNALSTILRKNAGYVGATTKPVSSAQQLYYRNKLQMPFGLVKTTPILGFYAKKTHELVSTYKCYLHGNWSSKLMAVVRRFAQDTKQTIYNEKTKKGLLRHLIGRYIDDVLIVTLVINGDSVNNINLLVKYLKRTFKKVTLYLSINTKHDNVIMGDRFIKVSYETYKINVSGIILQLSPHSFFQVNDGIRELMYSYIVEDIIKHSNPTVIDAFGGVGLIGALCSKAGADVYNIEIEQAAIDDAKKMCLANNINVTNICGDAKVELPKLLKSLLDKKVKNISLILDPPRKGIDLKILEALIECSKKIDFDIYYISCNAPTLSRDLGKLAKNFNIDSIKPYDMFPQTQHLETVVKLKNKRT